MSREGLRDSEEDRRRREDMVRAVSGQGERLQARVLDAMRRVPRHLFVPGGDVETVAYADRALGIGFGQTISAPHMVAIMCSLLDPRPGQRVLEVGAGSGYHAAVLADLVGPEGRVVTVEVVPELAYSARDALDAAGVRNVEVRVGDGAEGAPDAAPFDRVTVAAASPSVPDALVRQLGPGGRLVIPVGARECDLVLLERVGGDLRRSVHGRCLFVPLTGAHGVLP